MYIESVPNRDSPPAVLPRESWREHGKVRKRTLANLSCLPASVIDGLKRLLRGGVAVASAEELFTVERSLRHGHVAVVLGSARGSGAAVWFGAAPQELQPLLLAMLVARIIEPGLGGGSGHAHLGAHPASAQARGHGLGEFTARPADRSTGPGTRAVSALAVR